MHAANLHRAVGRLRPATAPTDRQLLHGFAAAGDPAAFAELVGRHGPMVLRVCRRVLRHEQDAEDAFQATFLVLARRAGSVRRSEAVASWLHGVAHRVALRTKRDAGRRRLHERAVQPVAVCQDPDWREVLAALDAEVRALAETYRVPFVLCALEGKSRAEAAAELGLKEGTVWSRLSQARALLRERLGRRGVELPALLTAVALADGAAPAQLLDTTARAVLTAGGVSARVAALATAGGPGKVTAALLGLVAVGLLAAGGVLLVPGSQPPPPSAAKPAAPSPPEDFDPDDSKYAGFFRGHVTTPDGKPLEGASIYIVPFDSTRTDPGPVRATTDAAGKFEFDAPDMTYKRYDGRPARYDGLLLAHKPGYGPDSFHTWGPKNDGFRDWMTPVKGTKVVLRLAPDDVPVRGRLLDPDGKPLAGARVRLTGISHPIRFDLDDYLKTEAEASLTRGFLSGTKTHERSLGRPELVPGLTTETRTDADGRFTLTGVGRDRLASLKVTGATVQVAHLEVMSRVAADVPTLKDSTGKPTGMVHGSGFTKKLEAGFTVRGVVRDRQTQAPVAGMWVTVNGHPVKYAVYNDDPAVTAADGRFTLTGLSPSYRTATDKSRNHAVAYPKPGTPYFLGQGTIDGDAEVVIECVRGVPFRLKVLDEAGKPMADEATVESVPVLPNPAAEALIKPLGNHYSRGMTVAARRADGTYEGFVLPGPGAVTVEMDDRRRYRPALVDPKAFFAPDRKDWPKDADRQYGTRDTLATLHGSHDQTGYQAVVLVNPEPGAKPLELSATVVRDRPRQVTLLDPDGRPVVGVESSMRWPNNRETQEELRTATFAVTRLHPDRVKQMTFVKADRRLIGLLLARGDGDAPYTVRMQPWATVTGRLVDTAGQPRADTVVGFDAADPDTHDYRGAKTDKAGRFRVERLIPGVRYAVAGVAEPLTLRPGEDRDVGDVRGPTPAR